MESNLQKLDRAMSILLQEKSLENTLEEGNIHRTYPEKLIRKLIWRKLHPECEITGSAKAILQDLTSDDVIKEVAKQALKVARIDNRAGFLAEKYNCIKFFDYLKAYDVDGKYVVDILKENEGLLEDLISSFAKIRYIYQKLPQELSKLDRYKDFRINYYLHHLKDGKATPDNGKAARLDVNYQVINECRMDILFGWQLKRANADYALGKELFASFDIGNHKQTQEDSVLLIEHPKNKKFKMLVVADGVGGAQKGELASYYVTNAMLNWFESLEQENYHEMGTNLEKKLDQELEQINNSLLDCQDGRASTIVCAIVGENDTLVTSVGDSRAYLVRHGKLKQITRDDSLVQEYYEEGKIANKDDIRFHKDSNLITQALGAADDNYPLLPNHYWIPNGKYQTLILMTDGVHGCLSDSQIMAISNQTPREEIARKLVESSLQTASYRSRQDHKQEFRDMIEPGMDNSSAAVYSKAK